MILTVCNLKGGSAKTTSAAFLAHALAERGHRVMVIDADPQGSITRWAELAEWRIPVRGMATGRLHVPGTGVDVEAAGHDVVVIDTPPTDRDRAIVESAIRAATHVVVPLAPTALEYERMAPVHDMITDLSHLGRHGLAASTAVLLTRTVLGTHANHIYRDALTQDGWRVLRPHVQFLQRYAQAFGAPVLGATRSAYGDAVTELLAGPRRLAVAG